MDLLKILRVLARVSLVSVLVIFLAGSVVRMTGSGMGCPDWPKCFGRTIPPFSEDQVTWSSEESFFEGQMIVYQEALFTAKSDFISSDTIDLTNWEPYTKHDYAIFNAFHSWVEFINRLTGVVAGIPIMLTLVLSFVISRKRKTWWIFGAALGVVLMMAFEAWLGKLVVDGNLIPGSITIHMVGAILILFLLQLIITRTKENRLITTKRTRSLLVFFLICAFAQLLLGTQVREAVDVFIKEGVLARGEWIENLPIGFIIHRSFSWVILLLGAYLIFQDWRESNALGLWWRIGSWIAFQIGGGIVLAWFGMPKEFQPLHLMGSILMLVFVFERILSTTSKQISTTEAKQASVA